MHVVIFGLSLTSSWGNGHATTYRGLLSGWRQLGHTAEFFERDVDWYARHRDLPHPWQAKLHLYRDWNEIRSLAQERAAAADATIVGSYFPDAIRAWDDLLGRGGGPVCFYDIDTPITLQGIARGDCPYLKAAHIPAVDLYLSFTGGPVLSEVQTRWHARRVRPLYCACDEGDYRAEATTVAEHPIALSFLGTYAPDRQGKLERLLLEPARQHPELQFEVAGSLYPNPSVWPRNVAYFPHLPPSEHPRFYGRSRMTLNLTRQAMVEAGYSPSVRLFEAAACATAIVSDPWPGLSDFFQPDQDILLASNTAEIDALLVNIDENRAKALGSSARQRVLERHRCLHRARDLASFVEAIV